MLSVKRGFHRAQILLYPAIYNPILKILEEKFNIMMTEESERPDGLPTSHPRAKL